MHHSAYLLRVAALSNLPVANCIHAPDSSAADHSGQAVEDFSSRRLHIASPEAHEDACSIDKAALDLACFCVRPLPLINLQLTVQVKAGEAFTWQARSTQAQKNLCM